MQIVKKLYFLCSEMNFIFSILYIFYVYLVGEGAYEDDDTFTNVEKQLEKERLMISKNKKRKVCLKQYFSASIDL